MSFINVGALIGDNQRTRPATKRELREAIKNDPGNVRFDCTSAFGPEAGKILDLRDLTAGTKLVVVGPDPFKRRNWYANVEFIHARGTDHIKVS